MVHYISDKQLTIFDFKTPFNVVLSADNRWVVMSKGVPWNIFANHYISIMHATHGRPGISPRTILGALIFCNHTSISVTVFTFKTSNPLTRRLFTYI